MHILVLFNATLYHDTTGRGCAACTAQGTLVTPPKNQAHVTEVKCEFHALAAISFAAIVL